VHDLAVHARDRELVIATHGRGFFVLDVTPFAELSEKVLAERAHLYPVTDVLLLQSQRGDTRSGDRVHRAPNPPRGAAIWYSLAGAEAKGAVKLKILDVAGKEVAELGAVSRAEHERGLFVARWDLRVRAAGDGEEAAEGEGRRRRRVSRAPAGKYRAVLELGELRLEQPFELLADPLIAESELDGPDPFR